MSLLRLALSVVLAWVIVPAWANSSSALGAGKNTEVAAAGELVQEALHREIYGLASERESLLERAVQLEPNYAPAKWHQGMVLYRGKWMPVDEVPQWSTRDRNVTLYEAERDRQADNLEGHLRLANWCRQQRLSEQERAHLLRVLELSPDHLAARTRLGYRQLEGEWVDDATVETIQRQQLAREAALKKWTPRLEELRKQLSDRSEKERRAAARAIRAIDDPTAIPAMELILARHSRDAAQLVVETVGRMPDQEAADALVSLTVLCEWPEVRSSAARELGSRRQETYVPQMISGMFTPVVTRTEVVPLNTGGLMYRHQFQREGADERHLVVLDTRYRRVPMPGGDRRETQSRAWLNSMLTAISREQSVAQQNAMTSLLNSRIADALVTATGQQLPPEPQRWWDWWNQENSVVMQSQKPTRSMQSANQVAVVDQTSLVSLPNTGSQSGRSSLRQMAECFAAGTLVTTVNGPVAIEKLRVGDLVLAQNIETGEISYKPVVRTSVRPEEPLVEFRIDRDTFRTTAGHLMWVSGNGWVKAKDLQSGMQIHSLTGAAPVELIEGEPNKAETFNLNVADFHTYFVGECRALSHDVTSRTPTRKLVPGLMER